MAKAVRTIFNELGNRIQVRVVTSGNQVAVSITGPISQTMNILTSNEAVALLQAPQSALRPR